MTALARIVVRLRFLVVAVWVVVAAFALPRSARVGDSLHAEGWSLKPTEAQDMKQTMLESFQRPTVSFMAVVISGPVPIDSQYYHRLIEVLSHAGDVLLQVVIPRAVEEEEKPAEEEEEAEAEGAEEKEAEAEPAAD